MALRRLPPLEVLDELVVALRRSTVALIIILAAVSGCAALKRSLVADPQADTSAELKGFSYLPVERKLWIYREAADDLIVCIPPPYQRYQERGPACTTLRDLRGYLYSLQPVAP